MVVLIGSSVRFLILLPAILLLFSAPGLARQGRQPKLPLEEIVQHFAEKEEEYAGAHSRYTYRLRVKVQEIDEEGDVVGEFEQVANVAGAGGRRRLQLTGNPSVDLRHLDVRRVELEDLEFVPLFILSVEDIPKYDITYLARERVGEVDTYVFRLEPKEIPRYPDTLFEGIVYVDADKLDIVRALGRLLPKRDQGVFKGYFSRHLELYRQPVDDYLFTTYISAEDVISARQGTTRVRLILRFSDHQSTGEATAGP
jgi:hypothetical protein